MADWQRHIKLNPEWNQAQKNEIPLRVLARSVARKLKTIPSFTDDDINDELEEIIFEFELIEHAEEATTDDFDEIMRRLYDWGDTSLDGKFGGKKVCWVDTISL